MDGDEDFKSTKNISDCGRCLYSFGQRCSSPAAAKSLSTQSKQIDLGDQIFYMDAYISNAMKVFIIINSIRYFIILLLYYDISHCG